MGTYYVNQTPISCIDHIYSNCPEKLTHITTINKGLSDHATLTATYHTKPTKPNLSCIICQTKPTKPNLPNQTYQTKPTKPNLPNQIKLSLTSLLNQSYQTNITGQSSQHLGP